MKVFLIETIDQLGLMILEIQHLDKVTIRCNYANNPKIRSSLKVYVKDGDWKVYIMYDELGYELKRESSCGVTIRQLYYKGVCIYYRKGLELFLRVELKKRYIIYHYDPERSVWLLGDDRIEGKVVVDKQDVAKDVKNTLGKIKGSFHRADVDLIEGLLKWW